MKIWGILNKSCNCIEQQAFELKNIEITMASRSKPVSFFHKVSVCKICRLPLFDKETQSTLTMKAKALVIKRNGLLSSEKIRAIRKSLKMSRRQFGEYLGVLPLSIYMWEKQGRVQNKSTDALIRLKCDPKYLEAHEREIIEIRRKRIDRPKIKKASAKIQTS